MAAARSTSNQEKKKKKKEKGKKRNIAFRLSKRHEIIVLKISSEFPKIFSERDEGDKEPEAAWMDAIGLKERLKLKRLRHLKNKPSEHLATQASML